MKSNAERILTRSQFEKEILENVFSVFVKKIWMALNEFYNCSV